MRSLRLRDRTPDRSLSVRFFDVLVRWLVVVADAGASLSARFGFNDLGPLAIAAAPMAVARSPEQTRPQRRARRLLALELGDDLAGSPAAMPTSSAVMPASSATAA